MKSENIVPINGRILIEVLPPEKLHNDFLVMPDSTPEKSNIGKVIAIPPADVEFTTKLEIGQKVLFNRHSGSVLKFDHLDKNATEYRLIKSEDIFALVI